MTQSAEGFIQVPANQPGGTPVREITGLAAEPTAQGVPGQMTTVDVEVVAIVDPVTFQTIQPMTKQQGDSIICLLKRIAKALER